MNHSYKITLVTGEKSEDSRLISKYLDEDKRYIKISHENRRVNSQSSDSVIELFSNDKYGFSFLLKQSMRMRSDAVILSKDLESEDEYFSSIKDLVETGHGAIIYMGDNNLEDSLSFWKEAGVLHGFKFSDEIERVIDFTNGDAEEINFQ